MILMSASAMGVDARSIEKKHRQQIMREAMIRNNGKLPIQVKAPQLKAETINLTFSDKPYVSSNSWGDPQVYISMTADENYGITMYVNGTLELENGKLYTIDDMGDWSSVYNNTHQGSGLRDADLIWSQDEQGLQHFEGFVSDTLGENGDILTGKLLAWNNTEYELYLTEGTPEKNRDEVITIDNAGLYIYEDLHKFMIWGCNEDSSRVVSISILSDAISGNYTIDDIELNNSYIAYDMNEMGYVQCAGCHTHRFLRRGNR